MADLGYTTKGKLQRQVHIAFWGAAEVNVNVSTKVRAEIGDAAVHAKLTLARSKEGLYETAAAWGGIVVPCRTTWSWPTTFGRCSRGNRTSWRSECSAAWRSWSAGIW